MGRLVSEKTEKIVSLVEAKVDNGQISAPVINASSIIEQLPVGVVVCTLSVSNSIDAHFINDFVRNLFKIPDNCLLPNRLESLLEELDVQSLTSQILEVFQSGRNIEFEWSVVVEGAEKFLSTELIPLIADNKSVHQVLCTIEDQTAEKLAEKNLLHHAFHDALTGQPNRVLLRNRLEQAVADCQRDGSGHGVAVLILNIDRFQQINDSFGHSAGDRFLVAMAAALRRCIRASDTLARLSGDEFAILVAECHDLEEVQMICDRIHDSMYLPYDLDGNEVFTSVSIGVATTLSNSTHPEDLIRDADFAMHRAKTQGKARTEIYERNVHNRVRTQFHLETELRRAVDRDELALHYQPLIGMEHEGVLGFEALTRWNHKEKGFVSPADFIPLAEETGIIVGLGRWALYKACHQIKNWIDTLGAEHARPVNVNVSGVQFARDDVATLIEHVLEDTNVPGFMLRIELTESAIMSNPGRIAKTLERVRDLGVKVALDDFGAGYSSLNYLHQFPIDIIKIDRSFINRMRRGNQTYEILRMLAMLADKLGHEIVGEGLEDRKQIDMLRDLNFDSGQGFFYSRPVAPDMATAFLTDPLPWKKSL